MTGLGFYDGEAPDIAQSLRPSPRSKLEITDLNAADLARGRLHVQPLGRGFAWFDAGTHEALLQAGEVVRTVETRQKLKIACVEEVAWRTGDIDTEELLGHAHPFADSGYGPYLRWLCDSEGLI